eukprot:2232365-Amphidinium_carterae.1
MNFADLRSPDEWVGLETLSGSDGDLEVVPSGSTSWKRSASCTPTFSWMRILTPRDDHLARNQDYQTNMGTRSSIL